MDLRRYLVLIVLSSIICFLACIALSTFSVSLSPQGIGYHVNGLFSYAFFALPFSLFTPFVGIIIARLGQKRWWSILLLLGYAICAIWTLVWIIISSQLLWEYLREIEFSLFVPSMVGITLGAGVFSVFQLKFGLRTGPSPLFAGLESKTILSEALFIMLIMVAVLIVAGTATGYLPSLVYWNFMVEPELYRVPLGYEGPILIVYDQPNGWPMKYDGRARIYDLPNSGVLFTQFSQSKQLYRPDFVYVDAAGRAVMTIPSLVGYNTNDIIPGDPIVACSTTTASGPPYSHKGFLIGHTSQHRKQMEQFEALFREAFNVP